VEQKNKGRARVKIAVFFVLAVHGIGLLALLMQGCRRDDRTAQTEATNTIAPPTFEATNPSVPETAIVAPTNPPPLVDTTALAATPGTGAEYVVQKGDTFSTIAKKSHVSVKAIAEANPTVEPTKLQIGQKLHIPPPTSPIASTTYPAPEPANGGKTYTVQSGNTLISIARQFGTTAKAIRNANNLKTDSIKVGQKLKIPTKSSVPTETASNNLAPTPAPPRAQ